VGGNRPLPAVRSGAGTFVPPTLPREGPRGGEGDQALYAGMPSLGIGLLTA
jgi:hypothetical protein